MVSEDDVGRKQIEEDVQLYGVRPEPLDAANSERSLDSPLVVPKRKMSSSESSNRRPAKALKSDDAEVSRQDTVTAMDWNSGASPLDAWLNQSVLPSTTSIPSALDTKSNHQSMTQELQEIEVFRNVYLETEADIGDKRSEDNDMAGLKFGAQIHYRNIRDRYPLLPLYLARRLAEGNLRRSERLRAELLSRGHRGLVAHPSAMDVSGDSIGDLAPSHLAKRDLRPSFEKHCSEECRITLEGRSEPQMQERLRILQIMGRTGRLGPYRCTDFRHAHDGSGPKHFGKPYLYNIGHDLQKLYAGESASPLAEHLARWIQILERDMTTCAWCQFDFLVPIPCLDRTTLVVADQYQSLLSAKEQSLAGLEGETPLVWEDLDTSKFPWYDSRAPQHPRVDVRTRGRLPKPRPATSPSRVLKPTLNRSLSPTNRYKPISELAIDVLNRALDSDVHLPAKRSGSPVRKHSAPIHEPEASVQEPSPDFWTGGKRRDSAASSMNSSLRGRRKFDPEEQNPDFARARSHSSASLGDFQVFPPPPIQLGEHMDSMRSQQDFFNRPVPPQMQPERHTNAKNFECDICGRTVSIGRRRDWQWV